MAPEATASQYPQPEEAAFILSKCKIEITVAKLVDFLLSLIKVISIKLDIGNDRGLVREVHINVKLAIVVGASRSVGVECK